MNQQSSDRITAGALGMFRISARLSSGFRPSLPLSLALIQRRRFCRGVCRPFLPGLKKLAFPPLKYEPPAPEKYRVALKSGPVAYVAPDHELPLVNIVIYAHTG